MIPDNYKALIKKLIDKTKDGYVIWNKTSRQNEFKVDLKNGAITTDQWRTDQGMEAVDFIIYNDLGEKIDSLYFELFSDEEDYSFVRELNNSARRSYFKIDSTINSILKQIADEGIIGKRDTSNNDPLPF